MKKLLTLICALFCMAQVCAANPVKQWGKMVKQALKKYNR